MNATSEPSILTDRPVSTPVPNFQTKVSLPPASEALVAFRDTECYSKQTDAIFCPMTTPLEYFDSFNVALYALASTETSESSPAIVFEESRLT